MLRASLLPASALALAALVAGAAVVTRPDDGAREPQVAAAEAADSAASAVASSAPASSPFVPASRAPAPAPTAVAPTSAPGPSGLPRVPRPGEPVAAADAAGLAPQLREAARQIADPATSDRALARQSHLYQVAIRALVNAPRRQAATYSLLDSRLRSAVIADVGAGAHLRSMIRRPKTALPPWRIVAPAPAVELLGHYRAAERELGVPWQYLAAIHFVETRMGRIRGVSSAGARGPMQFLPATWRSFGAGGDIESNRDSIRAAARYLRASGAPARIRKALFAYNRDNRYVDAVMAYADRMRDDPRAYRGYYGWQVYYVTTAGDVWLPQGFDNS